MPPAPIPSNERERIAALHSYRILDTNADTGFDDLTMVAASILNVPVSVVSLVDTDRQWFKSCVGLDARETPRDQAFCAYAIHEQEPLLVEDALKDPRVQDNPLVTESPKIRFYLGVPLIAQAGFGLERSVSSISFPAP